MSLGGPGIISPSNESYYSAQESIYWSAQEDNVSSPELESTMSISDSRSPSPSEAEIHSERALRPLHAAILANIEKLRWRGPLFHTQFEPADLLYSTWIDSFPADETRIMCCASCKRFLTHCGDLCVVAYDGSLVPLLWPEQSDCVPPFFQSAVANIRQLFDGRRVGSEFILRSQLGFAGCWLHLATRLFYPHLQPFRSLYEKNAIASHAIASYEMLDWVLKVYQPHIIERACILLTYDDLSCTQSHKRALVWLRNTERSLVHSKITDPARRANLMTRYAVTGLPHLLSLRSGAVGSLLQWLRDGYSFRLLRARWDVTRAQEIVQPSHLSMTEDIDAAEIFFEKLGYTAYDFFRRYATAEELPNSAKLWSSTGQEIDDDEELLSSPPLHQVFNDTSSLTASIPGYAEISFATFVLHVLPTAAAIEIRLHPDKFRPCFFTTALKVDAKPLMRFSSKTNTAAWHCWPCAKPPENAGLRRTWAPLHSILTFPHMWEHISGVDALDWTKAMRFKHLRYEIRFLLCLEGIKDDRDGAVGLALLPELMREEFDPFGDLIRAYSRTGRIEEVLGERQVAGGIAVSRSSLLGRESLDVRVLAHGGQVQRYEICSFD